MAKGKKSGPPVWDEIRRYAASEGLALHDAVKIAIHHIVLENCSRMLLSKEERILSWTLFGGTALRIAAGSPRFSEDLDFSMEGGRSVITEAWKKVAPFIARAITDALGGELTMRMPKRDDGDVIQFRVVYRPPNSRNEISVHLDNQIYPSLTREIITVMPPIPVCRPYSVPVSEVREMLANKIIALMTRNYFSGREVFDVVHFVRQVGEIDVKLVKEKMHERKLGIESLKRLERRISGQEPVDRAFDEWKRYLPVSMQSEEAFVSALARLKQIVQPVFEDLQKEFSIRIDPA